MSRHRDVEIAIVGTGIAGIATAYYLCAKFNKTSVLLIDSRPPMSYTSAQSGDNYRNWWPHQTMVEFTDHSIDLMEAIAQESANVFNMTHRGYSLVTRRDDVDALVSDQVDVISDRAAIREAYPALADDIRHVVRVRRGGEIDSQQLGAWMLERIRERGGWRLSGELKNVSANGGFRLEVATSDGPVTVNADVFINAAGPFAGRVAAMLGVELPIRHVFQQKIAFEDTLGAVPRDLPFTIDVDAAQLDWAAEEREMLSDNPELEWLAREMPGGRHCRPDGKGRWVKLGWAFNEAFSEPVEDLATEPALNDQFPEIVIRGASRMLPSLRTYVDTPPARFSHYGGYYSMTEENWPLIGPIGMDGAFMVAALSGFGSMAACAAGSTCASWACGGDLPSYAEDLSIMRYSKPKLLDALRRSANKGLL